LGVIFDIHLKKAIHMKKVLMLLTAAFLISGISYANTGDKGKAKAKKCCTKSGKCCGKSCDKTEDAQKKG
jgi:hypothetical protein